MAAPRGRTKQDGGRVVGEGGRSDGLLEEWQRHGDEGEAVLAVAQAELAVGVLSAPQDAQEGGNTTRPLEASREREQTGRWG